MKNDYIAHRREDDTEQTVLDHLMGTREYAVQFASAFGAQQDASQAALLHDVGKYSRKFQEHIRHPERRIRVDHATAGAQVMKGPAPATFAVAGHHGGLPDLGSRMDASESVTLWGRLKREVPDFSKWKEEVKMPQGGFPPFLPAAGSFGVMFYTRMLFSCLVDADRLDTERFMRGDVGRGGYESLETLRMRLDDYTRRWKPPVGELNARRTAILENCIQAGSGEKGLYTLTVPTGGGKTVASLAFALKHAVRHKMSRVVYVIPYTSIIDQTAKEFKKILGEDNVLEHHSGADYEIGGEMPGAVRKRLAAENWDAPVIVTTAVQFFESLFSAKPGKCRKIHSLADAVIVFDEAQTLPLDCLHPCVAAIAELVKHYGATAVLCTATQPALEKMFQEYGLTAREICPDTQELDRFFRRTHYEVLGKMTVEALSEQIGARDQALCVVNRRKTARELFEKLPEEGSYCLTTLIYPAARKALVEEIRGRLKQGLPCRVAATSLIEAGVDVDFPAAYRELAGLDSIIQTGGRCNREGRRAAAESPVYVFSLEGNSPPMLKTQMDATRNLLSTCEDMASPEAIEEYFTFLRKLKGTKALDKYEIMTTLTAQCAFDTISQNFKMMNENTRTVYIPLGDGAELVRELLDGNVSRALFRRLGAYGVNVYDNHFKELAGAGALQILESGDAVLTDLSRYDERMGLQLDVEMGQGYMF